MQSCKGCRQQQTNETLCLRCIEDLSFYLREIPVLYAELNSVRLPGSIHRPGPWTCRLSSTASPSPVRLEVLDLLDRGETMARLKQWTDTGTTVPGICGGFSNHLLATAAEPWAGDFYRAMKGLYRDLSRAVGESEEQPVGKCPEPVGDEICRGRLYRAEAGGVYCRRCGHKPEIVDQQVWVTAREAATIVGKPIETVRTWYKRGRVGWGPPIAVGLGWLPVIVRRAQLATVPPSGNLNHGSRAEPSPVDDAPPVPGAEALGRETQRPLTEPDPTTPGSGS